jgi:hypothetical protein
MDQKALQEKIEHMQRAAEEALQHDAAFFEVLHAIRAEIDGDPRVQSAKGRLQTSGNKVFSSFVPHVEIRIRTSEGDVSLPPRNQAGQFPDQTIAQLTHELRDAASTVIMRSRYRAELDNIVNEAVGASTSFEGIASEIEGAGHELVICVDLSAYAQLQQKTNPVVKSPKTTSAAVAGDSLSYLLSSRDLEFLKSMKITADEV